MVNKVVLPMVDIPLMICQGTDFPTLRDEIDMVFDDEIPDEMEDDFNRCEAFVNSYERGDKFIIFCIFNRSCEMSIGTVAHESLHILNMVYERIGQKHSVKNDEMTAHFLGYIVETLVEHLNKVEKENESSNQGS